MDLESQTRVIRSQSWEGDPASQLSNEIRDLEHWAESALGVLENYNRVKPQIGPKDTPKIDSIELQEFLLRVMAELLKHSSSQDKRLVKTWEEITMSPPTYLLNARASLRCSKRLTKSLYDVIHPQSRRLKRFSLLVSVNLR
jgi:hypothetical protein